MRSYLVHTNPMDRVEVLTKGGKRVQWTHRQVETMGKAMLAPGEVARVMRTNGRYKGAQSAAQKQAIQRKKAIRREDLALGRQERRAEAQEWKHVGHEEDEEAEFQALIAKMGLKTNGYR